MPPQRSLLIPRLATLCRPTLRPSKQPFTSPATPLLRDLHTSSAHRTMSEFASYTANAAKKDPPSFSVSDDNSSTSAWASLTPASAFDFRSDVTTTPTASMLSSIQNCTLLDDVFMEDPTTLSLERFIADLTGKEDAVLVLSGTMGNQVALRSHLVAPPQAVVCDRRCHIVNYEAGGVSSLTGAMMVPIDAGNKTYITLEEIQEHAVLSDDVHACPTRVISLENTLNGAIMPLSEVRRISAWARENGIILHMDGARLWEAVAAGAGTLKEFCAEMDSLSLCFSKGLGAPIGSIVVGTSKFVKRCRWIRKSIGGGLRQSGVVAAPARVAVEETFLGGKLAKTHENAKKIEKLWVDLGGKTQYPVDTNMVWLDLNGSGIESDRWIELANKYGLKMMSGRLVVHYQIGEEAIDKLRQVFAEALKGEVGEQKDEKKDVDVEGLKGEGKYVE